ncbi:alkaline phosphatase family protein [Streptomyces sp. GMY02]|uniref:alkaline phosphatase D family protein n=1 Tax=Streptomyces sp. GMY02 TaxID=1333528 RepID=UPI001C2BB60F|nr:alkaline phosphatase D family protein [Streptomyces sp. GMY02]QXE37060.1 alkaline phosphatase family protein [Streptomyces sp. GMY02]
MTGLRLGPLLRYVDFDGGGTASVWVEADRPAEAEVRCADGAYGTSRTFQVAGHHYALVQVTGLTPGTATAYDVLLDGRRVWPPEDPAFAAFPPSLIRSPDPAAEAGEVRVSFGSCRWASPAQGEPDPVGPDALGTLAKHLAADPGAARPDVLLLLGDQVYADETSEATRARLAERRDPAEPPGAEVADYEEYTYLYDESWGDPDVRWLLSTVPSCMIFDDHDLVDDWNTSAAWLADMRATPWWQERLLSGLMSYWVYQHLGNLSPAELAADPLYAAVRAEPDGTVPLRRFAAEADRDPACVRWSYRRDFGRTRLLMVDSRGARVLEESRRAMLDKSEEQWVRDQIMDGRATAGSPEDQEARLPAGAGPYVSEPGPYDHLLIGTSLPWLLPPFIHDVESWDAALCRGERGPRWARFGEKLRRAADLEHWAAFPASFERLSALIAEAGRGPGAPATVSVLSGDVHHAYVAEPTWPADTAPDARILQLTCSPVHNSVPGWIKLGFRLGWSRAARRLGHSLTRHGRLAASPMTWHKTGGPWFANQLMTLTLHGRSAELTLAQAQAHEGTPELTTTDRRTLTD